MELGVLKLMRPPVSGPGTIIPENNGQPLAPGTHSPPTFPNPPAGGDTEVPDAAAVENDVS
jgi:hypothetical protein